MHSEMVPRQYKTQYLSDGFSISSAISGLYSLSKCKQAAKSEGGEHQ
jgi:hypothetical protein